MSITYSAPFVAGVVGWELADEEWICPECHSCSDIQFEQCIGCGRPRQD